MATIAQGLAAVADNQTHHINAWTNPVEWNNQVAMLAILRAQEEILMSLRRLERSAAAGRG